MRNIISGGGCLQESVSFFMRGMFTVQLRQRSYIMQGWTTSIIPG